MPRLFVSLVLLTVLAGPASAAECGLTEPDVIEVDGLLDDWEGVGQHTQGGKKGKLSLRCNYDGEALYLAVLVEGGKPAPMTIRLAGSSLELKPDRRGTRAKLGGALARAGSEAAVSLQPGGWSAEVRTPIDPWRRAFAVPVTVDVKGGPRLTPMNLTFQEKNALYRQAMLDLKLKGATRIDTLIDIDGEPGLERVLAGKNVVAALGDSYSYFQIPVRAAEDVRDVRVLALGPRAKASVVVHYVERGKRGSREVLAVYDLTSRGFKRTFAHEIAKELDGKRVASSWKLVPRKKGGGQELVIEVGECVGFTEETWHESPAADMQPILLPWGETQRSVWTFDADQVFGG